MSAAVRVTLMGPRLYLYQSESKYKEDRVSVFGIFLLLCSVLASLRSMILSIIKLLQKREVYYLGFGDVLQLSTQINSIKHELGKRSEFRRMCE